MSSERWFVYILRCSDGSLYTGITNNLERRLKMHNAGTASRYTRMHRPVALVYREPQPSRSHALIRECDIKLLPKDKKEKLAIGAK
ncbi:MAG TPA: GIY-YIG nuclease family protein [Candidatus Omnitrophota bacterium]|nr:GIY-YIG nuclease family protein [Candidatus Omnitrophota bacterium]HPD84608.1 GIY-YIG nuclease family protein [Candidatus Omnitrophota bacterium]HRZ03466.1 GIY-YIG nuclease family protein [Candidatus Omnitrophota bacterium]